MCADTNGLAHVHMISAGHNSRLGSKSGALSGHLGGHLTADHLILNKRSLFGFGIPKSPCRNLLIGVVTEAVPGDHSFHKRSVSKEA